LIGHNLAQDHPPPFAVAAMNKSQRLVFQVEEG